MHHRADQASYERERAIPKPCGSGKVRKLAIP
jgi:hypothetical protein